MDGPVVLMWGCLQLRPTAHFNCFVLRGSIGYMAGQLYLLTTKDSSRGADLVSGILIGWIQNQDMQTEARAVVCGGFLPHLQLHYQIAHSSIEHSVWGEWVAIN